MEAGGASETAPLARSPSRDTAKPLSLSVLEVAGHCARIADEGQQSEQTLPLASGSA
jgi:hypothetical protein